MVVLPRAAGVAFLLLLLAGCSGGGSVIQIVEGHVTAAAGSRTASGSCDGEALVQLTASGQSGSVRMRVTDGAGAQVHDSGPVSGSSVDQSLQVDGAAGTWTLTVERSAYTGSYTAQVIC